MIILIGGMSHTGKTYLSQKLLGKYNIPYLCLDHLKMGLYRGLGDERYTPVQDYRDLGVAMWPIVKGIIMTAIENEQNMIIEGCCLLPRLINEFDEDYSKHIINIFLGFSPEYIRNNFKKITTDYARVIENRVYVFGKSMEKYIKQNLEFKKVCLDNGHKFFEIKEDYSNEMQAVYDYIDSVINA